MNTSSAPGTPTLNTVRLTLRELRQSDAPAVFSIFSDPETVLYWGHDLLSDKSQAEDLIRTNLECVTAGNCYYWAIEHDATDEVIGTCTLFKIDTSNRHAELGYVLKRSFWRRGLMAEAITAIIEFSFETLNMHRLEADTDPNNVASNALLEKFGFVREGFFRERWFIRGLWLDSDMWGLLKSDYHAGRDSP